MLISNRTRKMRIRTWLSILIVVMATGSDGHAAICSSSELLGLNPSFAEVVAQNPEVGCRLVAELSNLLAEHERTPPASKGGGQNGTSAPAQPSPAALTIIVGNESLLPLVMDPRTRSGAVSLIDRLIAAAGSRSK
jgi:hypothetical protein